MMDVSDCGGRQAYRLSIRTRLPLSSGPVAFSAASAPMPMYSPARPAARLPRLPRTRECRAGMCSPREGGVKRTVGCCQSFCPRKEAQRERNKWARVSIKERHGRLYETACPLYRFYIDNGGLLHTQHAHTHATATRQEQAMNSTPPGQYGQKDRRPFFLSTWPQQAAP